MHKVSNTYAGFTFPQHEPNINSGFTNGSERSCYKGIIEETRKAIVPNWGL
ncbi:MAG: hypothetical protein V3U57_03980 [Robiginitomaculum sp.]